MHDKNHERVRVLSRACSLDRSMGIGAVDKVNKVNNDSK